MQGLNTDRYSSYFYEFFKCHPEIKVYDENDNVVQVTPKYGLYRSSKPVETLFDEPDSRFLNGS